MTVNTKKVSGRRELRFNSFNDLLAEAERLCAGEVKMLGNWTLAQMFEHIASGVNSDAAVDSLRSRATKVGTRNDKKEKCGDKASSHPAPQFEKTSSTLCWHLSTVHRRTSVVRWEDLRLVSIRCAGHR